MLTVCRQYIDKRSAHKFNVHIFALGQEKCLFIRASLPPRPHWLVQQTIATLKKKPGGDVDISRINVNRSNVICRT